MWDVRERDTQTAIEKERKASRGERKRGDIEREIIVKPAATRCPVSMIYNNDIGGQE